MKQGVPHLRGCFWDLWGLLGLGSIRDAVGVALLTCVFGAGCADVAEPPPVRVIAETDAARPPLLSGYGCPTGEMRDCHIVLKVRADTVTCVSGVSECREGAWSECFRTTDPGFED